MTRAEAEAVAPDPGRARDFLAQARVFLQDAERDTTALESAVILHWNACISAMDAVLALGGYRIGRGDESHAVRIDVARMLLGEGYAELFERLDEWRGERHEVSYAAVTPAAQVVAALQTDARDVIAAAATRIG